MRGRTLDKMNGRGWLHVHVWIQYARGASLNSPSNSVCCSTAALRLWKEWRGRVGEEGTE